MPRDTKQYKALYFDLRIRDLERYYSEKAPKGAYQRIKTFMLNHGFDHLKYDIPRTNLYRLDVKFSNQFELR